MDHYTTLGLAETATAAEIKAAYRVSVKRTHPDAGGSSEAFAAVQEAYETLSDPLARTDYDRLRHLDTLRTAGTPSPGTASAPSWTPPGYPRQGPSPGTWPTPPAWGSSGTWSGPEADEALDVPPAGCLRVIDAAGMVLDFVLPQGEEASLGRSLSGVALGPIEVVTAEGDVYCIDYEDIADIIIGADGVPYQLITDRLFVADTPMLRDSWADVLLFGPANVRLGRYRIGGGILAAWATLVFLITHAVSGLLANPTAVAVAPLALGAAFLAGLLLWPFPLAVGLLMRATRLGRRRLRRPALSGGALGVLAAALGSADLLTLPTGWVAVAISAVVGALAALGLARMRRALRERLARIRGRRRRKGA